MIPTNLDQARAAHSALKEFFAAHPKGKLDPAAFGDLQALCRAAASAVEDVEIRRAIHSIENYSALLSSGEPTSRGADFVRLRVQNALASFRSKLKEIEAAQPVS
jgi:hypothetical protein